MPIGTMTYPMQPRGNSFLRGLRGGAQFANSIFMDPLKLRAQIQANQIQGVKAKYAEPLTQQSLQRAILDNIHEQLVNKYYGSNMDANIGQKLAYTNNLRIRGDYLPQMLQSDIAIKSAMAQKAAQYAEALKNILSPSQQQNGLGQPSPINMPSPQISSTPQIGGNGLNYTPIGSILPSGASGANGANGANNQNTPSIGSTQINQGLGGQVPSTNTGSPLASGMNYAKAAVLGHLLGFGEPKILDVNGTQTAITPFGNIPVAQGLTTFQTSLAKNDAKHVEDLENTALSGIQKQNTLDQVGQLLSDPEFKKMKQYPILGRYELQGYSKFGTPKQKKLVGEFMSLTGQIVKDSVRDFTGQFRIGEQSLLNSMKTNPSDSLETAMGKLSALSLMNTMMTQRAKMAAELMRNNGYSINKALDESDKQIDGKKIRAQINNALQVPSSNTDNNQDTVPIRNPRTGERKRVSREEARKMGINA